MMCILSVDFFPATLRILYSEIVPSGTGTTPMTLDQLLANALAHTLTTESKGSKDTQDFADDLAAAHFTPANDWDAFDAQCAKLAK